MPTARIRHHRPGRYDANVAVVWGREETVAPLSYRAGGRRGWFRILGSGQAVRVKPIAKPFRVNPVSFGGTVVSIVGVIQTNTSTLTGVPGLKVRLSDGQTRYIAIDATNGVE